MIRPLRKRHRVTWLVIFVAVSILFIRSYRSPGTYTEKSDNPVMDYLSLMESVSASGTNYDASLGTLESGEKVLRLHIKVLFGSPAPGIYLTKGDPADMSQLLWLGDVNETGNYQFKLNIWSDNYRLVVYDPVKKITLETFNFE